MSYLEGPACETLNVTSRFMVAMPQQQQHEQSDAQYVESQYSVRNLSGKHDGDEQWKCQEQPGQDAIEMHGWTPKDARQAP